MPSASLRALTQRTDLNTYNGNKLLLFALQIYLGLGDIHSVASSSLTDGFNDKKADLVYIDRDMGRVIIAQGYMAIDLARPTAPSNKASDLNTAASWLLGKNLSVLPPNLASAGRDLNDALEAKCITTVEFWYSHNLPESSNVKEELDRVASTAQALLRANYPESGVDSVIAKEIGRHTLDVWYQTLSIPILVSDDISIPIEGGFEESSEGWSAFVTSIQGQTLYDLFGQYKRDLFAANIRGYLGSRRSDKNINHNIKKTAEDEPNRFWAFNNGITALVFGFTPRDEGDQKFLDVNGLAIVNGAQTTGAISSVNRCSLEGLKVLTRFVKCDDKEVIFDIIKFNNTQNKIQASDFRSNDQYQDRLRREFENIPDSVYLGGRRGSTEDIIKRPSHLLSADTVAQSVASFHQDPSLAYVNKGQIWTTDSKYAEIFNDDITARHIILCYGLVKAIEKKKQELSQIHEADRTDPQKNYMIFFRQRGSVLLLCAAIGKCLEDIAGQAIPNKFKAKFIGNISQYDAIARWQNIVEVTLPFTPRLMPALSSTLRQPKVIKDDIEMFRSIVASTRISNAEVYDSFKSELDLS